MEEGRHYQETEVKRPMLTLEDDRDCPHYGEMEPTMRYNVVQEMFRNPNATGVMSAVLPSSSKSDPYSDTPHFKHPPSTDDGFGSAVSADKGSVVGPKGSAFRPMSAEVCTALRKLQKEIEDLKDSLCAQSSDKADSVYENIGARKTKRRHSSTNCETSCHKNAKDMGFYRVAHTLDSESNACRRFLWLLLLLSSLVMLSYQLWDRVNLFTSRPSHTSIDTTYVQSLAFPAVTICNLNMFKLTDLVNEGLYTAIKDTIGQSDRERPVTSDSTVRLEKITYSDFLKNVSHKKEDLIQSCTWNGKECGSWNLTGTITDLGLCYTFRFHSGADREIHVPGPSTGLSLVLNVEQYEYLLTPRTAVGVKVAVHEPLDPPRMMADGFNVAVGTHTSLAIRRMEYRTLPLSDNLIGGDTSEYDHQSADCSENQPVHFCKCHLGHAFQPKGVFEREHVPSTAENLCTVKDYFTCVRNYSGVPISRDECPCLRRCHRVEYAVSLSEAASSLYAAESRVLSLNEDLPELPVRFQRARDTYHRMDFTTFIHDSEILNETTWELLKVNTSFSSALKLLGDHRMEYDQTLKNLKSTITSLNASVSQYSHLFVRGNHAGFHFLAPSLKETIKSILSKQDILEHIDNGNEHMINDTLGAIMLQLDRLALDREYDVIVTGTLLKQILKEVQRFREDLVLGYGQEYHEFKNAFSIYDEKTRSITNITDKLISDLKRKHTEIRNISHQLKTHDRHSRKHKQDIKSRLMGFFESIKQLEQGHIRHLIDLLDQLSKMYATHLKSILQMYTDIKKAGEFLDSKGDNMQESFQSLQTWLKNSRDHVERLQHALREIMTSYESGEIPRSALSSKLNSDRLTDEIQAAKNLLEDIVSSIAVLHEKASILANLSQPLMQRFVDFKLKSRTDVNSLRDSLQFDGVHSLLEQPMRRMDDALSAIVAFQTDLEEYTRGCRINAKFYQNNFLQVDVFFQEMTNTQILQRRSYGIIDLACDIGGSLSLYLGASLLTFVALLDLLLRSRSSE